MVKEKFNDLDILEQLKYINNLLENKSTLTTIAKDLNVGRSTISDRFKKIGYRYNKQLNQYIKHDNSNNNTDVVHSNTKSLKSLNNNDLKMYNDSNTDVNNKIINITNEYETLMQMIELYKCNSNVLQNKIIINLPQAESELTSFRVNKEIIKQFNEFTKKQKEFRKIDLVSMALKEYIENHS